MFECDFDEYKRLMVEMAVALGRSPRFLSDVMLKTYWTGLMPLTLEAFRSDIAKRKLAGGKFPTVAELMQSHRVVNTSFDQKQRFIDFISHRYWVRLTPTQRLNGSHRFLHKDDGSMAGFEFDADGDTPGGWVSISEMPS